MDELRTPLGRARGLGSAKQGVGHFIGQRVSAAALVILVCWGLSQTPALAVGGYEGARAWIGHPTNAALLVLLVLTGFYHAQLGMRVIIEDYIEGQRARTVLLILNLFVATAAAAVAAVAILGAAFAGGAV